MRLTAACNVCNGQRHPEPCDCPCHGSEVITWLSSPEGERWSRATFAAVGDQLGVFGELKPLTITGPAAHWRPA